MSNNSAFRRNQFISLYHKITFTKTLKPLKCLIINPGPLYNALVAEKGISNKYTFTLLNENQNTLNLEYFINQHKFDIILIDESGNSKLNNDLLNDINSAKLANYPIYDIIHFFEFCTGRIPLLLLPDNWLVNHNILTFPLKKNTFALKRFFDILIVLILFPIAFFLVVLAYIFVKLSSKGPFIFKQKRVGKDGIVFDLYKIRTMIYSENMNNQYTIANDSRIFPIGKILRKTKIDELPQFVNILFGHMSLIGPRPEQVEIVNQLSKKNPYYQLRHFVRPGISGWAQIHKPTATPIENLEKLEYDLYYIKNINVRLEIHIILKTLKVILTLNSL
jgi:lipopolysaccharide/colanic/teichoic acid biosynthesis glycosyltransferase